MPRSFEWSLPFRFSNQNFVHIFYLSHVCCMEVDGILKKVSHAYLLT
jgi:hypothetical protein